MSCEVICRIHCVRVFGDLCWCCEATKAEDQQEEPDLIDAFGCVRIKDS